MSIFKASNRTPEQEIYCKMVDQKAKAREDVNISNGMAEHAVYLIAKLFEMAESEIRVYSDKLKHVINPIDRDDNGTEIKLYGHSKVVEIIEKFLSRDGTSLQIVIENDMNSPETHPLILLVERMKVKGTLKGNVSLRRLNPESVSFLEEKNFSNHFIISDNAAYRMELEDSPQSYKAFANFGDEKYAKKLIEVFDNFHTVNSEPILGY